MRVSSVAIVYGSTLGNTERVAEQIKELIGSGELLNVASANVSSLANYDVLLIGSSTWGFGELQDDWVSALGTLGGLDLSGKKVGYFGLGDQDGYSDTFCDALGLINEKVQGAEIIGQMDNTGYSFADSKAIVDGKLLGVLIDEDNESDKTDARLTAWVEKIKAHL
jgi:flavodoxin I